MTGSLDKIQLKILIQVTVVFTFEMGQVEIKRKKREKGINSVLNNFT